MNKNIVLEAYNIFVKSDRIYVKFDRPNIACVYVKIKVIRYVNIIFKSLKRWSIIR